MSVSVLPSLVEIYLTIRPLPESLRPCRVVRDSGAVLVAIDPTATRADALAWCCDNLSDEEANAIRAGFRFPPRGQPMPDWTSTADLVDPAIIPPCLLLHPVPAQQRTA